VEKLKSIIKMHKRDSEFRELDSATIMQSMYIMRKIRGLRGKAGRA
jgi:hypothetical protein